MQAFWHHLRRFAAALSGPSPERSRDCPAASPGEERAARMGVLLVGAAHDLCSPLTTMAVLVEELRQRSDVDARPEIAESLRIMSDQIEACRGILSRLAEYGERVSSLTADGDARPLPRSDAAQALQLSTGV